MTKHESCTGIDVFRLIAALLIMAIHTSPLASFSETGDFILTRVIARVAVPFFFMTSGYFLISRYSCNEERLGAFVKRTAQIYGMAIWIYIPVNLYNGYFSVDNLLPNIIKDLVFDGTFYHLWYLPASIVGAVIAWHLVKKLDYPGALAAASVLYLIGLFGDSYYGMSEGISWLNRVYELIFQISDHTRNGIFFAPVFFLLGGFIADQRQRISAGKSICGFGVSFALMLGEALVLRHFGVQRHDSMYVFLPLCMYFLFNAILCFKGKRLAGLRTISLMIYLIHPMMIVIIRLFAKLLHLQTLLVENSIVHYMMVCLTSVVFSAAAAVLWDRYRPKRAKHTAGTDRAYVEIDLDSLEHNVKVLREAMPSVCELMAVVKADAYGHGAYGISAHLDRIGVKAFAVATIDEGIKLRKYGVRGEILILGYTDPRRAREIKKYDLMQTLIDYEYAKALNKKGISVKSHIKIDTGMHRLGIPASELSQIEAVFEMKHIKVRGIFTHLCCSDSLLPEDRAFTKGQIDQFYAMVDALKRDGVAIPKLHIQSSYGFWNHPELKCDYIRVGVALYGVFSTPDSDTKRKLDLRPVLALKTKVVLIRPVPRGDSVGYGRSFTADRDSRIAILPIGYADGIPRSLSNQKGGVLIRGQYAPIVGRVCMDQLAVDVTEIEHVSVNDTATLISADKDSALSAPTVAGNYGSISNELLCRLGARLKSRKM